MTKKFSLTSRVKSFKHAFEGLRELFLGQHNAQIHLLAVVIVISIGFVLGISSDEWLIIILTMAMVVMAEALNTAIEYLADACMPEHHPLIGKAKDIAAAAVLICAIAAVVIAGIIFLPLLGL
jgi:diacylglycerol kinase